MAVRDEPERARGTFAVSAADGRSGQAGPHRLVRRWSPAGEPLEFRWHPNGTIVGGP
ncbi:hypothetical protein AB0G74_24400 [Streptomyces sp. NPDC020875]|uniref:hypothetical protein n=1 Tax=Streptomyces sp. NPDC020875 TaxID=3154898 RepID=UPI0033EDD324